MTDHTSQPNITPPAMQTQRRIVVLVVMISSLAGMYGPSLLGHVKNATDPMWFNDDCRAYIWPMLRYRDASLFPQDYAAQFFLDVMPIGYKLLYRGWSTLGDPRTLSKVLPYLLLATFLTTVGVTAWRLAGSIAAWGTVALCLSSSYFLWRMTGGLPRAFGVPLIGATAMALTLGRPIQLAVVACLGAALYPAAGLVSLVALAVYLLVLPTSDRGKTHQWSLRRRVIVVTITGVISVLLVTPTMRETRVYGSLIRPDQIATYPETGPGGRYEEKDRPPYRKFGAEALVLIQDTLVSDGNPWPRMTSWMRGENGSNDRTLLHLSERGTSEALRRAVLTSPRIRTLLTCMMCVGAAGAVLLATQNAEARRLLLLLLAALIVHAVALSVAPSLYVPARYADYPVPVLTVLLIPAGACALGRLASSAKRAWMRAAIALVICLVCLFGLGSRGDPENGFNVRIDPQNTIYPFLSSLPTDALIAGWPYGLLDNVPYLSQRRALITYETHAVLHQRFVEEMRRRMIAIIDAYFATDLLPLTQLRDQFGVTHLVLDLSHYAMAPFYYSRPRRDRVYFKPFGSHIMKAFRESREGAIEAERQLDWAGVYRDGDLVVLDLNQLRPQ